MLILEEELRKYSRDLLIATDDGTRGHKGFVTEVLQKIVGESSRPEGSGIDRVITIGPPVMMREAARVTKDQNIYTVASLNTIMVDGTGMCGGCRAYIDGQMKLACIDGPEFDAHEINFDEVISRLQMFQKKEKKAYRDYRRKLGADHD